MATDILIAIILTTLAGLATGIGSLISYFFPKPDKRYLSISLGFATGVMIFVAFVNLYYGSKELIGYRLTNLFFLSGMLFFYIFDRLIPHIHMNGKVDSHHDRLYRGGIMVMIGIAVHNLPEGLTVALVSLADIKLGMSIALAIALHNIPEGIACGLPFFCATGDKKKSCLYSLLAGMTEPLGAIIGLFILYPFLSNYMLAAAIAFAAGIMVIICFDELIPIANNYGDEHLTNMGIMAGFFVMIMVLNIL